MTLASTAPTATDKFLLAVSCPKHGRITVANTEQIATAVETAHNKTMHPRTYNRKLNKKR